MIISSDFLKLFTKTYLIVVSATLHIYKCSLFYSESEKINLFNQEKQKEM